MYFLSISRWKYGYFDFAASDFSYSLFFQAERTGSDGDIAIDDIKVTFDKCPVKDRECDFETTICHFSGVGS